MVRVLIIITFFISTLSGKAQTIAGKWKTIDDETGKPKSVVEIAERNGKFYGKIVRLFRGPAEDQDPICDKCPADDDRYKKKIIGMEILRNLGKDDDEYSGGTILDPNNGKIYRCKVWLEGNNLKLRGYLGPFFRTQTWLPER
ncbi:MAG: hypothetical protein BroJett042_01520 [Bacteroidota bacterium]|nr:MAG: hypothetical protein BroJett042_01520 [Bacteroidota bacterium]HNR73760.1 DUF2147 domain-containing protein [Cyclobacteriaceae bacterium]HNU41928.1 DUF2147 domain-containing protein [Cyclobacteriaceae bacterium]